MSAALLFELGWKSALVMGVALAVVALMRSRPAAEKSAVMRWSVLMLALLPAALLAPALPIEVAWLAGAPVSDGAFGLDDSRGPPAGTFIVAAYAAGVCIVIARLLIGLAAMGRWVKRAAPVTERGWVEAIAEARARTGLRARVLASDLIDTPLSCGWLRPMILIDHATLQRPEHARAILAHEAAHLMRGDWMVLMGLHVVAAIFWFNPLVWIAKHAAERYAEEAADQQALVNNEAPAYAQAVLDCARGRAVSVAVNMSRGGLLRRRLELILSRATHTAPRRWRVALVMTAATAFAVGVAAITFVAPVAAGSPAAEAAGATVAPSPLPARAPAAVSAPEGARQRAPVGEAPSNAAPAPEALSPEPQPPAQEAISNEASSIGASLSAPAAAPVQVASTADDPRRERWAENARRNQLRNLRRAEERERRDRARANRAWLQTQLPPGFN